MNKCELFNDNFQNYKRYGIPKAQLVIADIPYNLANNAYASNPVWYVDGNNKNGESDKANATFFDTDVNFNIAEFFHFCSHMLVKEPKQSGKAPAMIVFCSFQQQEMVIKYAKRYGFEHYIPITFVKKTSAQVLKANMRIVGASEYALVLYRDKLPKFNNDGLMVKNWFEWEVDNSYPKIHPTQKPIPVLKRLIRIFTDKNDVVIDPVAGSGSTLLAAAELERESFGFEINKKTCREANEKMLKNISLSLL
ncbi:site-specific DNA-methyltransferase [Companilactobacillus allii]|uniref:Methyltransferase n=1 Tax=Companilactobacillus allii TaxID=1847728 RepID=A0A1P8Q2K4_9LACO|nr:site-specific DNA-methyltransferase [Companilactobacillus allii]APX72056.1 site-specific DNA-methyltransferase [Companilactobacillus allii]USQ69147.1 site-specific DNA-methyltransferase [Companilactobacillus allii]